MSHNKFRCPFEVQWEKDRSILELNIESEKDIWVLSEAVKEFTSNTALSAVKIIMPDTLTRIESWIEWLRVQLIPYATELAVATIENLLHPFLPYQMQDWGRNELEKWNNPPEVFHSLAISEPEKTKTSTVIIWVLEESLWTDRVSREDLKELIWETFTLALDLGSKFPAIQFQDRLFNQATDALENVTLLNVRFLWGADFSAYHLSQNRRDEGTYKDNDIFWFVTSPYYSDITGRYSDKVTIVMTRSKDFQWISEKQTIWIRRKANTALINGWYDIWDIDKFSLSAGLWVPEM